MSSPADKRPSPLDAFLAEFWADVDTEAVRALSEYLARFPGDEEGIAREYFAQKSGSATQPSADRIAHYRILRQIGRGGQATIYLAEDTRLHRNVALKVLDPGHDLDLSRLDRFRREAEITSKLNNPGICPVFEAGEDHGVLWIAMAYVEGEPLSAKIATAKGHARGDATIVVAIPGRSTGSKPEQSPRPTAERSSVPRTWPEIASVLQLFEEAARVMHVAHEHGVIHRDLKPGNIMVTNDGAPVILDFGLAQDVERDLPTLTLVGDLLGTPAYMSPEQLAGQRIKLDRRTDVYSLGVSLFECLTLQRPFEAPTLETLYQAILGSEAPSVRSLNPSIPEDLCVVVATTVEKDRDHRYRTALDLAEELRRVRMHEPIVAKSVGPIVRLQRWAQRNPGLATAVGGLFAVLAIGLGSALFLLGQRDRALGEKAKALDEVTTQRDAKNAALTEKQTALTQVTAERNEKQAALSDYDRLGDLSRLQQLQAEADKLWPCEPSKVEAMKAWVDAGTDLQRRLDGHRDVLTRLRAQGRMAPAASRGGESRGSGSGPRWLFESASEQFKHDTTEELVANLTAFVDPDPKEGLLSRMRQRLAFSETVERDTIGNYGTKWADAVRSIADEAECPKYRGLEIKPQLGLIPIGKHLPSGLWEFAHLQTTAPGTNPVPKSGADGRLVVTESMGLVFVLLPGGTFRMGAMRARDEDTAPTDPNVDSEALTDESPIREVTLDPFFMSKYEMTQGQWLRLVGKNPSQYPPGRDVGGKVADLRDPVESVSWDDCDVWLGRLGLLLPTEAQWEYAARGGTSTPRWTGIGTEGLDKAANVLDEFCRANGGNPSWTFESWNDGYSVHAPVGSFAPNPFGLHDVLGNVWEWCRDWYGGYDVLPRSGDGLRSPTAFRSCTNRGGSWLSGASSARSAYRNRRPPGNFNNNLGVRPCRAVIRD